MNSQKLSEMQAPVRQAFSVRPESAEVVVSVTASLSGDCECLVENPQLTFRAGLPSAVGGSGKTVRTPGINRKIQRQLPDRFGRDSGKL